MNPELEIRAGRPDHPQVVALLDTPEVTFPATLRQGRGSGSGAGREKPPRHNTGGRACAGIRRMDVDPGLRGQRIGQRMLQQLASAALGRGPTQAQLETGEAQTAAERLYERFGYRRCGTVCGYPDDGLSVFLRKDLA